MPIDIASAERFVLANARLLDRHRLAVLLHGAPAARVLDGLRPYRNPDGGFGHGLEPDVRAPDSDPACTLQALEQLDEVGALGDPMVSDAAAWLASAAEPDGGVPFRPGQPRAPFLTPSDGGSFLTFALAAALLRAGSEEPWLRRASEWCWAQLEHPEDLGAYPTRCALAFLDAVPEGARAGEAIERLRTKLEPDGTMRVTGGTEHERLTPLTLSERPGARSRALFSEQQIEADLDLLEQGQRDDGGWTFDWLEWSAGQSVDCRGMMTLRALTTLRLHGRLGT